MVCDHRPTCAASPAGKQGCAIAVSLRRGAGQSFKRLHRNRHGLVVTRGKPPRPHKGERTSGPGGQSEPGRRVPSRVRYSRGDDPCCDGGALLFPGAGGLAEGRISLCQTRTLLPARIHFDASENRFRTCNLARFGRLPQNCSLSRAESHPSPGLPLTGPATDGQQRNSPKRREAKPWRSWRSMIRKVVTPRVDATRL
jgi:hypothetical protein